MKPARIFQQYIWLVNKLSQYKRLSLEELNNLWLKDEVIGGSPLNRNSFIRHKDAILNMFGIIIECDREHGYKYYIANPEVLKDDAIERWMLSTLTVNTALSDSSSLSDRILLEDVPAGEQYLQTIIQALRINRRLVITYQRFGCESYEKTVSPYSLKLFQRRWYLLTFTGRHYATYSLDRMLSVELSDETFELPVDFSADEYFSEYYGVLTDDTPIQHVVIRAYDKTPNYLRTLPLHRSQRELESTDQYTAFCYDIRPTTDFLGQLQSHGDGIEVVSPPELRQKMKDMIARNLKRY